MSSRQYLASLTIVTALLAFGWPHKTESQNSEPRVIIEINKNTVTMAAAKWVSFRTVLRNEGSVATPFLIAHLSIAGFIKGQHVDPEDWSPRRTQYLPPIQPGESVRLNWKIHALFEGKFASFVTIVSAEDSFPLFVSPSLQLEVSPSNILRMKEVIPVVAIVPILPLALLIFVVLSIRRRID